MQRYLVTGAAGNLARQLVAQLLADGKEVLQLDLARPPQLPAAAAFETGDIANREWLAALLDQFQPDCILHMASMLSRTSEQDPERAWEVNATASVHLLLDAQGRGVQRFFFPSTNATYAGGIGDPMSEEQAQWPSLIYGVTKVAVERMGVYLQSKTGFDFRAVRLPIVLSPFAPQGAATAYASHAFVAATRGDEFVFPVTAEQCASSIYVRDVTEGILRLIAADGRVLTRRIYNLHAFAPTAGEVAAAIGERVPGFTFRYAPDQMAMDMIDPLPRVIVDASARADWGWAPRFDLPATADDMLATLRNTGPSA
jgi:threonine 3-dehydrogenase